MLEKTANLKVMRCPTCGANLKVGEYEKSIVCVYCGNTIVPISDNVHNQSPSIEHGSTLKVEGIKTPSSALAYIDLFFEDYDWDAFCFSQTLSIDEIDKLAESLKTTCADDKNTWFVCFKAIYVPFVKKVEGCKTILNNVIDEYKRDNLDAYSMLDAYKRITETISFEGPCVIESLKKIINKAVKYGATSAEASEMKKDVEVIDGIFVKCYEKIEDIPEISRFISEKNAKIAQELALKGIYADSEIGRAKQLIEEKKFVEALDILYSLNGYADSREYIKIIDRCFRISNILEIEGEIYCLEGYDGSGELAIYSTKDKRIQALPIVENIKKLITNYADDLYYLNTDLYLKKYSFSKKESKSLLNRVVNENYSHLYDGRIFLISSDYDKRKLWEFNIETGEIKAILEDVKDVVSSFDSKIIYTVNIQKTDEYTVTTSKTTRVIDVDTGNVIDFEEAEISVEGFVGNYVIYTQKSPNDQNKNLYIRSLDENGSERLLEKNIFAFSRILSGRILYYVGNARNKSLISINPDGTDRREWPLYISNILFEQGGWMYFIRKAGYNAVLCKCRAGGTDLKIIAADIERFIEIKNGYMYYINDDSALVKVRMDGSNLQNLCDDVESVLSVKEDKIIFVSIDGFDSNVPVGQPQKIVKSIYMVDFTSSGKKKLAYNIKDSKQYDENTVYYIATKEITSSKDDQVEDIDILYRLDVATNENESLLEIKKEKRGRCYVATCVYGSYDCPEVWTLRRFRDNMLGSTWYGRLFIRIYYAISPTIVKWFGETSWFKHMWQSILDRMVNKLNKNGVENTPYKDKEW